MAGAKAPAVFFGLGLRLRAQEGQYEAPRALTALGASTMQDVSDQKSVHGTTPLCCGDPTDLRSFSACGLSHSVRPAGSLASSSSRMISTVGGAERQPYHVALDTHHEHPPQLPALRAMTTASPPLVEEVYEQHGACTDRIESDRRDDDSRGLKPPVHRTLVHYFDGPSPVNSSVISVSTLMTRETSQIA